MPVGKINKQFYVKPIQVLGLNSDMRNNRQTATAKPRTDFRILDIRSCINKLTWIHETAYLSSLYRSAIAITHDHIIS